MDINQLTKQMVALRIMMEEHQKEQERIAIKALVAATRFKLQNANLLLQSQIETLQSEMIQYTTQTVVGNIEPVVEGQGADALKEKLRITQLPAINSPIK